ncbi:hypothetical protein PMAYCL1PPCAC_33243, partial [Pristionchus mayeri]
MNWGIRIAYLINIIAHIAFDWIVSIFVRVYVVPPYGLFYSEGLLNRLGCCRQLIMGSALFKGVLGASYIGIICTFYVLMMQMYQLTVANEFRSYWKLSQIMQAIIYVSISGICILNVVGFVIFGTDVENYAELIKTPELSWMAQRGGALLLFGEPGKYSHFRTEFYFLLLSALVFLPLLFFFMAHALIFLHENERVKHTSINADLFSEQLEDVSFQMGGALVFFIIPLSVIMTMSVVDLRDFISDPVFAAIRFTCVILMYLNPPQLGLVFILRNETHRRILLRRFQKI